MVYVTTFEQKSIAITTTNRSLQKQLTSEIFSPSFQSSVVFSFDKSVKDRRTQHSLDFAERLDLIEFG